MPHPRSGLGGGYPTSGLDGGRGYPAPGPDGGGVSYPADRGGIPFQVWMGGGGVPHLRSGQGGTPSR